MAEIMRVPRVKITPEAAKVIDQLRAKNGDLMFHQNGCCLRPFAGIRIKLHA